MFRPDSSSATDGRYEPRHLRPAAPQPRLVGEDTRVIRAHGRVRSAAPPDVTGVIQVPVRGLARGAAPVARPAVRGPRPWWRALGDSVRNLLGGSR